MPELKSNIEWKRWGKSDPLWSVASWADKQKGGSSPWTEDEFYALGQSDWQDFENQWRQYGMTPRTCLEIGCGAGRITRQLARTFERVEAVDVSEQMIVCARKAVAASSNVSFALIDGLHLPQRDGSVQAVFSAHVLQHLDSVDIGFAYFSEFFRVLDAGGTLMIHLPVYQFPGEAGRMGGIMRWTYAAARKLDDLRAVTKRRFGVQLMRGTPYPIRALTDFLADLGFRKIELRIFTVTHNRDPHPFIFATK